MGERKVRLFKRRVTPKSAGLRLDTYIFVSGTGFSRTQIQRAIKEGKVLVNGRKVRASYKVKAGDYVEAEFEIMETPTEIVPQEGELEILYEDGDMVVINKPPGMVVHPAKGHFTGTVVNFLYHKLLNAPGAERRRPGIVHRLDKDTSGVMVIGKSELAVRELARQIAAKEAKRIYLTVVWGDVERSGTVEAPIGRHPIYRERMAITVINAKPSTTDYRPLKRFGFATLLEVSLRTGRTHQIRVHMEYLGHPVVGDPVYSGRDLGSITRVLKGKVAPVEKILSLIDRQALHAWKLKLRHPRSGKRFEFVAPLPDDFVYLLNFLEGFAV
ncbi:MAG: RluA family pseudouridine synthase [Thermotogae bacterium]|nr:RluA family pseudouridine synthase [Thermotogota bacterium]